MAGRLRVCVVGVGALGSVHARVLAELSGAELSGVVDADGERARAAVQRHGGRVFADLEEAIAASDAAIVAVPTTHHREVAGVLLEAGLPCLVEKPLARSIAEGRELVELARSKGVALMVGHVERFNPAIAALVARGIRPRFAEAHRVSPYSFRSADIGVVMDVMIHDIDLILHLVGSRPKSVHAVGVGVLGEHEDLANARILFENGAVANVTASRLALKWERKLRLFAPDCYVSLDLRERKGVLIKPGNNLQKALESGRLDLSRMNPLEVMLKRLLKKENLKVKSKEEPLMVEDREFVAAIREGRDPAVTGEHGVLAMETAELVTASIRENLPER